MYISQIIVRSPVALRCLKVKVTGHIDIFCLLVQVVRVLALALYLLASRIMFALNLSMILWENSCWSSDLISDLWPSYRPPVQLSNDPNFKMVQGMSKRLQVYGLYYLYIRINLMSSIILVCLERWPSHLESIVVGVVAGIEIHIHPWDPHRWLVNQLEEWK